MLLAYSNGGDSSGGITARIAQVPKPPKARLRASPEVIKQKFRQTGARPEVDGEPFRLRFQKPKRRIDRVLTVTAI